MIMMAAAAVLAMLAVSVPLANAAKNDCPHKMGSHQRLSDADGAVVQEWTISGLRKSTDGVPGYPVAGQLWEATASVHAVTGSVTPLIPNLGAVSGSQERYPALWQVASPYGIPAATIAQGHTATGKVYFDVTGEAPAMVTYQGGGGSMAALMWCDEAAMKTMMAAMKSAPDADCPCCADMPAAKGGDDCCADKP
ncbi:MULTISPECIES: DUF1942 domain-containing protein [Mycobacteroides]|uniref:Immunogenic protein MPT63 n=4 Tax=Mycobacteroides TaxID=670516 RepID=A0AB74FI94_9MYCO|nr:DUF1942 domain-containing protein [Mycobacteroides chelonae]ANO11755.1 immunogenic protein MPT63 [Mycobacteroides abscessus]EIV20682.1 hypothetical protein MA3A0119R_5188 [Mycobacteroides abscessus 3A-0119-R]EIV32109.1 hypothetical protein MA3A0122S_5046 [Mycobacteroides abscessus 3A-0122-S]EIV34694.1 hypothetical protein MA3A0731_5273 [Mycobacteroides abscessus 3A-0731]EPZ20828.1 hypothetical protein M879_09600 [Mycobacteroides abscessus V06705]OLT56769.1 immunogenic protein MPT63 [Mycoba